MQIIEYIRTTKKYSRTWFTDIALDIFVYNYYLPSVTLNKLARVCREFAAVIRPWLDKKYKRWLKYSNKYMYRIYHSLIKHPIKYTGTSTRILRNWRFSAKPYGIIYPDGNAVYISELLYAANRDELFSTPRKPGTIYALANISLVTRKLHLFQYAIERSKILITEFKEIKVCDNVRTGRWYVINLNLPFQYNPVIINDCSKIEILIKSRNRSPQSKSADTSSGYWPDNFPSVLTCTCSKKHPPCKSRTARRQQCKCCIPKPAPRVIKFEPHAIIYNYYTIKTTMNYSNGHYIEDITKESIVQHLQYNWRGTYD